VIKSLGPLLAAAPCAAGATLIGDRVLLVVDLADVAARARHPTRPAEQAVPPKPRASRRARILVAEDSPILREGLRRELTSAGFDVVTAVDGSEALQLARSQNFDAISTDVMMPKMDGYDLARALRKEPRYQTTPIVMVTSKDARIDTLRGHDAGADAYLTKPTDPRKLVATLDALLSRREKAGSG
jgi:CheY-like chemotaxis protein